METYNRFFQREFEISYSDLNRKIADVQFNGNSAIADKSLYTVLSASLPVSHATGDLLAYLDQNSISVSGGSACSTGSASHVLKAIGADVCRNTVRFSFSKYNTVQEIDYVAETLADLYKAVAA
ncbi:cysteine sulfinate desulfinase/cysteine desulfurase-like protein [Mucilaginibacter sp. UYP25]|uniref:aminotransferase class V-fold PLP-dependent enzyme n=1 Tax=unclassified Mucilaginibacter TaxID=2617802 RepID=UPI0033948BD0